MTPATAEPDTLADIVRALGDVPLHRILWHPFPGTATEEDVLESQRCELVDGLLVHKSVGFWKGALEVAVGCRIVNHFGRPRPAVTFGSGPHRVAPGVVRLPDVAYTRWDRLLDPDRRIPEIAPAAPDLVVEIPTPDNTPAELARKRKEFFAAGCRLLWELDPDERTAVVFTTPDVSVRLAPDDSLDGGPVLPGFRLPLAELYADLDPPEHLTGAS
jgi:Uma2 family endonuclease